jgi:putative pyruvate formate lyase activating enzyme
MNYKPSYLKLSIQELKKRAIEAKKLLSSCTICPWNCYVNRLKGELGHCRSKEKAKVSSYNAHFGEEPDLVGRYGSGTIFFSHCNLDCVFCQNWEISHGGEGSEISPKNLADLMLALQGKGCHNINLVTPTPHAAAILEAVPHAVEQGLQIPFVYNSGGYDSIKTLQLLEGVIDIYMPDFKFWDAETSHYCSGTRDYPKQAREALKEMQRQVGDLKTDKDGIAYRGLLVRHLVLPNNMSGTKEIIRFLSEEISPRCKVNIMGQYYPAYEAHKHPHLDRPLSHEEFREAKKTAALSGLRLVD